MSSSLSAARVVLMPDTPAPLDSNADNDLLGLTKAWRSLFVKRVS
jgi:hypothetical protein